MRTKNSKLLKKSKIKVVELFSCVDVCSDGFFGNRVCCAAKIRANFWYILFPTKKKPKNKEVNIGKRKKVSVNRPRPKLN